MAATVFPCTNCVSRCRRRDEAAKKYMHAYAHGLPLEACEERTVHWLERVAD